VIESAPHLFVLPGAADVNQLSRAQLAQREVLVVLAAIDPIRIQRIIGQLCARRSPRRKARFGMRLASFPSDAGVRRPGAAPAVAGAPLALCLHWIAALHSFALHRSALAGRRVLMHARARKPHSD
jgi:hypothetical protein